jgi:hypothetical protein
VVEILVVSCRAGNHEGSEENVVTLGMYMREDFQDKAIFISRETAIGRNISHSSRTSRRVNGHRIVLWLALCMRMITNTLESLQFSVGQTSDTRYKASLS